MKKELYPEITDLMYRGPQHRPVKTADDLIKALKVMKVTPSEAFRIIATKKSSEEYGNVRFNWKMIRFTFYVWARVKEDKQGYLKPKVDTIRSVVTDSRFRSHYFGYFPDEKFDEGKEFHLLNKLIAERAQQKWFKEGLYVYEKTRRVIPQSHLDAILYPKK